MRSRTRGAASVELAIMMVVLVPTFMYFVFLQDLLWYKLEMQETVVSTPWDFSFVDWNQLKLTAQGQAQPPPEDNTEETEGAASSGYDPASTDEKPPSYAAETIDNVVTRNSRRTYCDHTSAYDGNVAYDCQHQDHHTNYAAHQCWLVGSDSKNDPKVPKGQQVTCTRTLDTALAVPGSNFNDTFNAGGVINCTAKLGVTNYFLPNKFFAFWSKNDVTSMKRFGGNASGGGNTATHGDAQGATAGNAIIFNPEFQSVLHDPWAVNRPEEIDPDSGSGCIKDPDSRFRARMLSYWDPAAGLGLVKAHQWHMKMGQDRLLSPASMCDEVGDFLHSGPLAWKKEHTRTFGNGFGTSGWNDPRQRTAYGARQGGYFAREPGYY